MTSKQTTDAAQVAGKNGFSLISDEKFRELYSTLLQCTLLDNRLQTVRSYEHWSGAEAGTAGVVACLRPGDSITLTPHGLLAQYFQTGSVAQPRRAEPTAIAQLAAATGDALRHRLEKLGNIAAVFASRGDSAQMGEIFETATKHSLPVLYVFESGEWLAEISGAIPVMRVDGADAVAVYRVAHESIRRARDGGGPTIMECDAWLGESEPPPPLAKLENYLAGKNLFRHNWKQRLEKKYTAAIDEAFHASGAGRRR